MTRTSLLFSFVLALSAIVVGAGCEKSDDPKEAAKTEAKATETTPTPAPADNAGDKSQTPSEVAADQDKAADTATAHEAAPSGGSTFSVPTVKLLGAGSGEKRQLRYRSKVGNKESLQMEMEIDMEMNMQGQALPKMKLPTMRMGASLEVSEVTADGKIRQSFRYEKAQVMETPGAEPMVVQAMEQALTGLDKVTGYALITDRGLTLEGQFKTDGLTSPQVQQMLQSVEQSLRQLGAPLPEEAVGKGATWEVTNNLEMNGIKMTQVSKFELVELKGDKIKLKVALTQTAPKQTFSAPGQPPGMTSELLEMKSSGSGTMEVDLNKLVPTSILSTSSDMKMKASAMGQAQELSMKMGMGLRISPK